jgi:hypothetical protein
MRSSDLTFVHGSFQDYFCAESLRELCRRGDGGLSQALADFSRDYVKWRASFAFLTDLVRGNELENLTKATEHLGEESQWANVIPLDWLAKLYHRSGAHIKLWALVGDHQFQTNKLANGGTLATKLSEDMQKALEAAVKNDSIEHMLQFGLLLAVAESWESSVGPTIIELVEMGDYDGALRKAEGHPFGNVEIPLAIAWLACLEARTQVATQGWQSAVDHATKLQRYGGPPVPDGVLSAVLRRLLEAGVAKVAEVLDLLLKFGAADFDRVYGQARTREGYAGSYACEILCAVAATLEGNRAPNVARVVENAVKGRRSDLLRSSNLLQVARLWQQLGRIEDARRLLSEVVSLILTESSTPDLWVYEDLWAEARTDHRWAQELTGLLSQRLHEELGRERRPASEWTLIKRRLDIATAFYLLGSRNQSCRTATDALRDTPLPGARSQDPDFDFMFDFMDEDDWEDLWDDHREQAAVVLGKAERVLARLHADSLIGERELGEFCDLAREWAEDATEAGAEEPTYRPTGRLRALGDLLRVLCLGSVRMLAGNTARDRVARSLRGLQDLCKKISKWPSFDLERLGDATYLARAAAFFFRGSHTALSSALIDVLRAGGQAASSELEDLRLQEHAFWESYGETLAAIAIEARCREEREAIPVSTQRVQFRREVHDLLQCGQEREAALKYVRAMCDVRYWGSLGQFRRRLREPRFDGYCLGRLGCKLEAEGMKLEAKEVTLALATLVPERFFDYDLPWDHEICRAALDASPRDSWIALRAAQRWLLKGDGSAAGRCVALLEQGRRDEVSEWPERPVLSDAAPSDEAIPAFHMGSARRPGSPIEFDRALVTFAEECKRRGWHELAGQVLRHVHRRVGRWVEWTDKERDIMGRRWVQGAEKRRALAAGLVWKLPSFRGEQASFYAEIRRKLSELPAPASRARALAVLAREAACAGEQERASEIMKLIDGELETMKGEVGAETQPISSSEQFGQWVARINKTQELIKCLCDLAVELHDTDSNKAMAFLNDAESTASSIRLPNYDHDREPVFAEEYEFLENWWEELTPPPPRHRVGDFHSYAQSEAFTQVARTLIRLGDREGALRLANTRVKSRDHWFDVFEEYFSDQPELGDLRRDIPLERLQELWQDEKTALAGGPPDRDPMQAERWLRLMVKRLCPEIAAGQTGAREQLRALITSDWSSRETAAELVRGVSQLPDPRDLLEDLLRKLQHTRLLYAGVEYPVELIWRQAEVLSVLSRREELAHLLLRRPGDLRTADYLLSLLLESCTPKELCDAWRAAGHVEEAYGAWWGLATPG